MADPISIIGTAGALANIIDVLGKVINTVNEYRRQWQEADLAALNLESQLAALSTALNKIKQWADSTSQSPHHQLVIDLDRCVLCCRTLIGKIDVEVSQFQVTPQNQLDVASKFRLLLKTRDFEHVQRMIEQQTGALTLLLVACNTTMLSEQQGLLEQPQTRKVFKKMQDDTASLYVHRDIDSLITATATSITSSKRSLHFDFDAELFVSRIYEKWIRGSVKKTLHDQQSEASYWSRINLQSMVPRFRTPVILDEETEQRKRSQKIDKDLGEDSKRLRREARVLVLGDNSRAEILRNLKIIQSGAYSEEELFQYKSTILRSVLYAAKDLADDMRRLGSAPESDKIWDHVDLILGHVPDMLSSTYQDLPEAFVQAVQACLGSSYYLDLKKRRTDPGVRVVSTSEYWLAEIRRIAGYYYVPTKEDISRMDPTTAIGIWEHRFQMGQLSIHMLDPGLQRSERKKWIHCFENVTAVIFVVDLTCYDQVLLEDSSQNRMMESLLLFDSVVNSRWFMRSSVILFLTNAEVCKQKLNNSPMGNYFPDYSGGNDINKALKYILWRFNQVNRANLEIFPHLVEVGDGNNLRLVFAAVKQTILRNELAISQILSRKRKVTGVGMDDLEASSSEVPRHSLG